MSIEDFTERFHLIIPVGDYTTLAGLVSTVSETRLKPGSEVDWNGIRFVVNELKDGLITSVTVELEQAYQEDDQTQDQDHDSGGPS